VLLSTRLSEVRGFSDLTSEFFAELPASALPPGLRLTVLANKPSQEFKAFQVGLPGQGGLGWACSRSEARTVRPRTRALTVHSGPGAAYQSLVV
jgi:hypothetical protein